MSPRQQRNRRTKDEDMSKTYKITGSDAVRIAQRENLTVVNDGESAPYVIVTPTGWRNAKGNHCDSEGRTVEAYFNTYTGEYLGPDDEGVEPCWNEAPENPELLCGTQIQVDRSGQGHAWRNIDARDIPHAVREEIEGEILDGGKEEVDEFVASNGARYRW